MFDFKKEFKEIYSAKKIPAIITVPKMNYVAVRGSGDPNEEGGAYQQAVGILYAISYALKMSYKTDYKIANFFEYVVPLWEGCEGKIKNCHKASHKKNLAVKIFSSYRGENFVSVKQIAILVKNFKEKNLVVAGFDLDTKKWLRPISSNSKNKDAVIFEDATYLNGEEVHEAKIFDVVEIQAEDKISDNPIQPENFYYVEHSRWKKIGETTLQNILKWRGYDEREQIFFSDDRTISPAEVKLQDNRESLLLLSAKNFVIRVEGSDRKKFYAHFDYNDKRYLRFSIGDIKIREQFEDHDEGEYFLADEVSIICSLTNPFFETNLCYKMVAQVFN
mgnify:CR=1 FL=1